MVVNVEVPPFVDVRVIGDLLGAPAICFQLDLVLREIEEGEVGFALPPPVQGVLPGWVTFWRRIIHGAPSCARGCSLALAMERHYDWRSIPQFQPAILGTHVVG